MFHLDSMRLDSDASLAFQVHVIEDLGLQVFARYCMGILQQSVCQGTLTVVDMRYYAEISDIFHSNYFFYCKFTQFISKAQNSAQLLII
jgi:hypothetical protein